MMKTADRCPEVSVIVPLYNTPEKFLTECIDSVLAQEFRDFELLLVDDGSDTSTAESVDRLSTRDNRIRVLHRPNGGVSAARNSAIDEARGCYVTFVDSDDTVTADYLTRLVETARYTGCQVVHTLVTTQRERLTPAGTAVEAVTVAGRYALERMLRQKDACWSSSVGGLLIERSLAARLRFSPLRYEDLDLHVRLYMDVDRVAMLPVSTYAYRRHDGSFTSRFNSGRLDSLDVTDNIVRLCAATGSKSLSAAAVDRAFSAACNVTVELARYDGERRYDDAAARAWSTVKKYRRAILTDGHARFKNRCGALAAMAGRRVFTTLALLTRRRQVVRQCRNRRRGQRP